jgi:hypothetical protein
MPYDPINDIKEIRDYYASDPLQERFSALITGESGSGKSFLLRTCRFPLHIDSFDPGGTKGLKKLIDSGDIVADTRWENEDPYKPGVFKAWKTETDRRIRNNYFKYFGTYALDSASSWGDAAMNFQLKSVDKEGEPPKWNRDYTPQKVYMINYIKKLMTLPCDFILTGHLRTIEEIMGQTKGGQDIKRVKYRFFTTGQAMVTIPMQFDELYVLIGKESQGGLTRKMLVEAQGVYIARSRLKADGLLSAEEEPDIKKLLKKIGMSHEDKPKLDLGG